MDIKIPISFFRRMFDSAISIATCILALCFLLICFCHFPSKDDSFIFFPDPLNLCLITVGGNMLQTLQVMNNKMLMNFSSLFLKASTKRWTKIGANLTVKVNSCLLSNALFAFRSFSNNVHVMFTFSFSPFSPFVIVSRFPCLHWLLVGSQRAESYSGLVLGITNLFVEFSKHDWSYHGPVLVLCAWILCLGISRTQCYCTKCYT